MSPPPVDPGPAPAALRALLAAPRGQRIGVLGLGISGQAMALFLSRRGAAVLAVDASPTLAAAATLHAAGITVRLGTPPPDVFAGCAALAISPGVDPRQPAVAAVRAAGRPVFGELALAGRLPAAVVAVTGTNGKSTTVALIGALIRAQGRQAFVGGNFGEPVVAWLDAGLPADFAVLELSSFQLEAAYDFAPEVGVVLNVAPDHLDRYADLAAYAATKANLVAAVPASGRVVLNADDPQVVAMAARARAPVWYFSARGGPLPGDGLALDGDTLVPHGAALAGFGRASLAHPALLGRHNRDNALAAYLALAATGLARSAAALAPGYAAFAGLPHRLQVVGEAAGVVWINDSKATNDAAAATGVRAMERPTWLLAGGQDKGGGYAALLAAARAAALHGTITFGAAGPLIAAQFAAAGLPVWRCSDLAAACAHAAAHARAGDAVLLSPACASFDAFAHYRARGDAYAAWVAQHIASRAGA